ncbi:hypothetical protein MKW92_046575 [Papaver armeniacum]|nr:hypothetical protein MKW92_046575 [Papaver armeniacum]
MYSFNKTTQTTSFDLLFLIHLHLLFFLLINITICPLASHGCYEEERRALLNFKSFLEDPSNRLISWQEGILHENCCNWDGIRCSDESSHVVSINLRNTNLENYIKETRYSKGTYNPTSTSLTGKLSPSLFNITYLEYLDLGFNNFQEPDIPFQFSDLNKLTHLDLSNTNFSTSISTHFSNLSSLQYLDLSCKTISNFSSSCLESPSIKWMRGLVNLRVLKLSGINLAGATSSEEIFAEHMSYVSNIRYLDLSHCNIRTTVFPIHALHNLSHLSTLKMNDNYIGSLIPEQLANFTSLSVLNLSYCQLQGSVPYLPQLRELDVSFNYLQPNLTRMFENRWPKLKVLQITSNQINGPIPSSISNAPSLVSLSAAWGTIQGSLPSSIYNLSGLHHLDLSKNDITSSIHSSISNLKKLNSIDLSYNKFQGSIPSAIFKLKGLRFLDLSRNIFHGPIPNSISNLKDLHFLDLSRNNFQGPIPNSICKVVSLRTLVLESNKFTGTIPSCITMLKNLVDLHISKTSIEGNVSFISLVNELSNLTTLDLSSNRLRVTIDQHLHLSSKPKLETLALGSCNLKVFPTFICNMTHLKALNISHNNLRGAIPSCISKLENLVYLDLSNNNLRGRLPLPPKGVQIFDLSHNKLNGEVSIEAGKRLSSVNTILLNGNGLSGSIPFSICSQTQYLDLSNNKLSGIIPTGVGYCNSLIYLNLGNNFLTENVPKQLENAKNLLFLQLNDNNLSGTFPNSIEKLLNLEILDLGNNNIEGIIPPGLGLIVGLKILSLRSNNFSGPIPEEIYNLPNLQILDLSINNLSGSIFKIGNLRWLLSRPTEKYHFRDPGLDFSEKLMNFQFQFKMVIKGVMRKFEQLYVSSGIDLSCNALEGNIPEEIGQLEGLSMLNLSHNQFSGLIPASVGSMKGLESLDLRDNKLSGLIPQSLASLDFLSYLNLSSNNFSGRIPRGEHFDTLSGDGSVYANNSLLCGFLTNRTCDTDQNSITNDKHVDWLVYSFMALGFGVGFWGPFFVLLIRKEKWWFGYWRLVDIVAVRVTRLVY